jgi:SOS response regulatory protein OraA/RecX
MKRPRPATFEHAVALLARQERTRQGLRSALLSKGHGEDEVAAALTRAEQLGYLDDRRVALAQARRELSAGRGRQDVARRLVLRGVDQALAEHAVIAAATELGADDEAAARALLARRRVEGPKAARLLIARGFDEDLVRRLTGLDDG